MKRFTLLVSLLCLSVSAHAEITCADRSEAAAEQKMEAAIKQGIVSLFKQKKIAFDPATIVLTSMIRISDNSDVSPDRPQTYASFTLREGKFTSAAGTPFSVDFSGSYQEGKAGQYPAFYEPKLTSKGFDREGNPIDGHCSLLFAKYVGYANEAEYLEVTNSRSGQVIGKISLPQKLSLY